MGGRDRFGDVVVGGIAGRRAGSEASIDDDSRRSLCPSPAVGKRQDFPVGLAKTNTWAAASVSWCDLYRSLQNMAEKLRSEERRVGKECVSTCRYRRSPDHIQKK